MSSIDSIFQKRISLSIALHPEIPTADQDALKELLFDTDFRESVFAQIFANDLRCPMGNHQWSANNNDICVYPLGRGATRQAYLIDQEGYNYVIKLTDFKATDYNTLNHELSSHISGVVMGKPILVPRILSSGRIASVGQYYPGSFLAEGQSGVDRQFLSQSIIERSQKDVNFDLTCALVKEAIDVWKKLDGRFIVDAHQAQFRIEVIQDSYLANLIDRGYFRQENAQVRLELVQEEGSNNFVVKTSAGDTLRTQDDYRTYFFEHSDTEQITFPELVTRLLENLDIEEWISDIDMGSRLVSSTKTNRSAIVFATLTHDLKLDHVVDVGSAYLHEYLSWSDRNPSRADAELIHEITEGKYSRYVLS